MTFNLKNFAKILLTASVFIISSSVYSEDSSVYSEDKTCEKRIQHLDNLVQEKGSYLYIVQCKNCGSREECEQAVSKK